VADPQKIKTTGLLFGMMIDDNPLISYLLIENQAKNAQKVISESISVDTVTPTTPTLPSTPSSQDILDEIKTLIKNVIPEQNQSLKELKNKYNEQLNQSQDDWIVGLIETAKRDYDALLNTNSTILKSDKTLEDKFKRITKIMKSGFMDELKKLILKEPLINNIELGDIMVLLMTVNSDLKEIISKVETTKTAIGA
jgi:hypothetical protein